MDMSGEYRIAATRERVWAALNDPALLAQAIPGCEELKQLDDGSLEAVATQSIGPVKARFRGKVVLSDLDPPNGYTLSGEGSGGAAGFAKGEARVRLEPDGEATRLVYSVKATIGGKLAQIGQRLIDQAAKKMADDFFTRFGEAVVAAHPGGEPPAGASEPSVASPAPAAPASGSTGQAEGLSPMVWVTGFVVLMLVLVIAFGML